MRFWHVSFHMGVDGNPTGIGDYWRNLAAAGIGYMAKVVDNPGAAVEAADIAAFYNVPAHVFFRLTNLGWGTDVPQFQLEPKVAAALQWERIVPHLERNPGMRLLRERLIIETGNEPGGTDKLDRTEWLAAYALEFCLIGNSDGWRVCPLSFNAGLPGAGNEIVNGKEQPPTDVYRQPMMRQFINYASDNPAVVIGYHGAKLSGGLPADDPGQDHLPLVPAERYYPWTVGRWIALNRVCAEWGIAPPYVAATEWAFSATMVPTDPNAVMPDVRWLQGLYQRYPNALGVALWTLHKYTGDPADELNPYIPQVADLALDWDYPADPEPSADWRLLLWQHSKEVQAAQALRLNWQTGIMQAQYRGQALDVEIPVTNEHNWSRPDDGRLMVWQAFENPSAPVTSRLVWVGAVPQAGERWEDVEWERITPAIEDAPDAGVVDGFDAPIGTADQRAGVDLWPGTWFDANPYLNYYEIRSGVWTYHTGADLNNNRPVWDADNNAPVYAAADGVVVFAGVGRSSWGNMIVIRHALADGRNCYTRYAHLRVIADGIMPGARVARGHWVGNVGGAELNFANHLHFDIAPDPAPGTASALATDPQHWPGTRTEAAAVYTDPKLWIAARRPAGQPPTDPPPVAVAVCAHGRADPDAIPQWEIDAHKRLNPTMLKFLTGHAPYSISAIAAGCPNAGDIVLRVFWKPPAGGATAGEFVEATAGDLQRSIDALAALNRRIWVEIHNEPNLVVEGLGKVTPATSAGWADGVDFGVWLAEVIAGYKRRITGDVKYLYPGLSPGPAIAGVRMEHWRFLSDSVVALRTAGALDDLAGFAGHIYWGTAVGLSMDDALRLAQAYRNFIDQEVRGGLPLWITEASIPRGTAPADMGWAYAEFPRRLAGMGVWGVAYFVMSASNHTDFGEEVWLTENGSSRGILESFVANR